MEAFNEWIDKWISLVLIRQAYEIETEYCLVLAKRVPCKFGPMYSKPIDLEKIDAYANDIAQIWFNRTAHAILENFFYKVNAWWTDIPTGPNTPTLGLTSYGFYKFLLKEGNNQHALKVLQEAIIKYLVIDLETDKVQTVLALDRAGYFHKNDVNGLTKTHVNRILADGQKARRAAIEAGETAALAPSMPTAPKAPPEETASIPASDEEGPPSNIALPPIKNRVSAIGSGNTQVRKTYEENPEAVVYARKRMEQDASLEDIAVELKAAGGSLAVVGCILQPNSENIDKARERAKHLLRKARQG